MTGPKCNDAAMQAGPAQGAPLALGPPQPAGNPGGAGQGLLGGFGAASSPAATGFGGSTTSSLMGAAPVSSPALFGGVGAFGTTSTLTQQPSVRKGKSRK